MATVRKRSKKATRKKGAAQAAVQLPYVPLSEVVAVIAGAGGVFLSLAILSYHPTDPSWSVAGAVGPVENWMGAEGAKLADALVAPFGAPAIVVPLALVLLALSLLRHRSLNWPILRGIASIALTLFSCLLLALYPGQVTFRGAEGVAAGGWVGETIVRAMMQHFNFGGTLLIVIAGLILSLQMTLALEIGPPVMKVMGVFRGLAGRTVKATGQVVVAGAGAVGNAAISGVSSVGQRLKDETAARREAAERRRLELAADDADLDDMDEPAARAKSTVRRRGRDEQLELGLQRGRGGNRSKGADLDDGAMLADDEESFGAGCDQRSARGGDVLKAEATLTDEMESDAIDDLEPFDEEPPSSTVSPGRANRRGRDIPQLGPKIVKSRYMEESGAYRTGERYVVEAANGDFVLPSLDFLKAAPHQEGALSEEELIASARVLEAKLRDYGVEGNVVEIHPGPVITMYEYAPAPGVKVSKITNLSNDLALALKAISVRIVAPLPGKAAVGIEVPNRVRQTVYLREIVEHEEFRKESLKLPVAIGKDIEGKPYAGDMARMPHLLVAGSTGAGKSVAVNAMLLSLLYSRTPEEVRLILVDPKMIEFSVYNEIPHLLMPVVTDPKKAALALSWGVDEMTRRYQLLTLEGARNIASYNSLMEEKLKHWDEATAPEGVAPPRKLPYIVIVIDELADLMMVAGKEVQDSIVRLAQMARAAGIHLILATQRPSVDVITGLIKANFPSRIAFKVSSKTDSRTILDANGAEYLLGNGDMLFLPPGTATLLRLHGAFVSDEEARVVVEHLRKQGQPRYEESLLASTSGDFDKDEAEEDEDYDEKYEEAKQIVLETGQASISTIQRRLKIGYNRSARMVERMAREGLIGPPTQGGKPREIFANKLQASLR